MWEVFERSCLSTLCSRRRRNLCKTLFFCYFVVVLLVLLFEPNDPPRIGDGSYRLISVKDGMFSSNRSLSSTMFIAMNESLVEEFYWDFVRQSKISTPLYRQLVPSTYILYLDDHMYQLDYDLNPWAQVPMHLVYRNRRIPFVQHIAPNLTRPNQITPLLPIPHGQVFEYQNEQRFSFAVRQNNQTKIYLASLSDQQVTQLRYGPLGLDQYQHHRWLFFVDQNHTSKSLLAVTHLQPHVIVKIDVNTGLAEDYARTSQPHLFSFFKGEQIFLGSPPILLPNQQLFLGVFHTNLRTDLLYTFSAEYPFEVQCVFLVSPFHREPLTRHPINEIHFENDQIVTSEGDEISLITLLDHMQSHCQYKTISHPSIALQWFPSVIPTSIDMPPFIFNPAVLRLPQGSRYPFVAVARSNYDLAIEHRIAHPNYQKHFQSDYWGIMLACLMDEHFTCVHIPHELYLFYPIEGIVQRYNQSNSFPNTMAGAEDPRLIWSETNAPLLIYGMNALKSDDNTLTTRLVWIIDIRHVFEPLVEVLPKQYSEIPFYTIKQGVQLNFQRAVWEKNWMAFIHRSQLLIGYSIEPKLTIARRPNFFFQDEQRWFYDVHATSQHGVHLLFPEISYETILHINPTIERVMIDLLHQGPNALLIKTNQSKFYFTIIHQRVVIYDKNKGFPYGAKETHYMHYPAIFSTETPYPWLAISRQYIDPILSDQSLIAERDRKFLFVTTIAFMDVEDIANGYGRLDSRLIISYGLIDRLCYVWVGRVSELMINMRSNP